MLVKIDSSELEALRSKANANSKLKKENNLGSRITELVLKGYNIKFEYSRWDDNATPDCIMRVDKDGYAYSQMAQLGIVDKFHDLTEEDILLMTLNEIVSKLNERIGK